MDQGYPNWLLSMDLLTRFVYFPGPARTASVVHPKAEPGLSFQSVHDSQLLADPPSLPPSDRNRVKGQNRGLKQLILVGITRKSSLK